MIRSLTAASALCFAMITTPVAAQDADPAPPPGPAANVPPPTNEGALLGGSLTPGATAAALGIGIAIIAIASGGSDGSTTTTTTTSP